MFQVRPAWPDTLVVQADGDPARELRLHVLAMDEPPQVVVPAASAWAREVPAWAVERRRAIVDALVAARCVIVERDGARDLTLAPDGRLHIEQVREWEDRIGDTETVRFLDARTGRELGSTLGRTAFATFRFPDGAIEMRVADRWGQPRVVHIDSATLTFTLEGQTAPLSQLLDRLGWNTPAAPYAAPRPRSPAARRVVRWGSLGLNLMFVAIGVWMAIDGDTTRDRWVGAACVVFFGACAWVTWDE